MWNALGILAATEVGATVKRNMMALGIYMIAGVALLMAILFGLFGFYQWLLERMNGMEASLTVSATLLGVALLIACIGYFVKNRRQKTFPLAATALVAAPVAARMISRHPKASVLSLLGVVATGMILSRSVLKPKAKNDS